MIHATRFKLIGSYLAVSILAGGIAILFSLHVLYNVVILEATQQVGMALNAAEEVYQTHVKYIKVSLNTTILGEGFRSSVAVKDRNDLAVRVDRMARYAELDFAGIVLKDGHTLCRIGPNALPEDERQSENSLIHYVMNHGKEAAGTVLLSEAFIGIENPAIAADIHFLPLEASETNATAQPEKRYCMAIGAAIPIYAFRHGGDLTAILYGGKILNQSTGIVDIARQSIFFSEIQQEKTVPTTTILFGLTRIATNMVDQTGNRAVGSRIPEEVKQPVLTRGRKWTARHLYFSERYIAAFRPLSEIAGNRIGMLSVAVPEANYLSVQRKFLYYFLLAMVIGGMVAVLMGYGLSTRIMGPMHRLIRASREVSEGNLSPDIGPVSKDREIAILQTTFQQMVASMRRRRLESRNQIMQSEKQASVGRLAAGVAHEINNPLTGVLTFTHMLLRRKDLGEDIRSDLEIIAESTERVRKIVKGLLDFSRQTKLNPEPVDVNRLVDSTIKLLDNQALLKGVNIRFNQGELLPKMTLDRSQMQSVLLNIMLNALDACRPSDTITVSTLASLSVSDSGHQGIEIIIEDTGEGILPDHINKLFDPFFSTKEVGKGTGLGLSVSLGIVREHGGDIRVLSEVGKGSRFFIWLPIEKQVEHAGNDH